MQHVNINITLIVKICNDIWYELDYAISHLQTKCCVSARASNLEGLQNLKKRKKILVPTVKIHH